MEDTINHYEFQVTDGEFIVNAIYESGFKEDLGIPHHAEIVKRISRYQRRENLAGEAEKIGYEYFANYLCPTSTEKLDFFMRMDLSERRYFERLQWFIWQWMVVLPKIQDPFFIESKLNDAGFWLPDGNIDPYRLVSREQYISEFVEQN